VQRAILKQLAEHPTAIICDLGQVEAIDPRCGGLFTSLRHPALGWPGTALVLCGVRPAVADILLAHGVAEYLAIYPSLDEALANTRTRPSRLRARLMLGPAPTAARAGREFVREVCGRWGLEGLADPAALLASELVTNAVLHARTTLLLRVELRRSRLQLAVTDQDPDLTRVQAARDGAGRGLGLLVVDRVAPPGGCATARRAERSSGAHWSCHHRTRTWSAAAGHHRRIPAPPPRPSPRAGRAVALPTRSARQVRA
jgi:anti-anti-sigma regulatory factor